MPRQLVARLAQQSFAGDVVVFGPTGSDEGAEVAEPGGGQQGVDQGMGHDVAVGVALAAVVVGEVQARHHARLARFDAVGVGADPDSGDHGSGHFFS